MRTLFFFVFFAFSFMSCQSFSVDPLLQKAIDKYKVVVQLMDIFRDQIKIVHWVTYAGDSKIDHYEYYSKSIGARLVLDAYKKTDRELDICLLRASLGDGFILGILIGCCSRLFKQDLFAKKTIIAGVLAAAAWIAYQNSQIGVVPSYSYYELQRSDNIFATVSFGSFFRLLGMVSSAAISYVTTRFVIDKIASRKGQTKISR